MCSSALGGEARGGGGCLATVRLKPTLQSANCTLAFADIRTLLMAPNFKLGCFKGRVDPLLPTKPRWYDINGHTANSTIVQLNDRIYWSQNKAKMVGESHRQVFESSLGAIYNRMHEEYPA